MISEEELAQLARIAGLEIPDKYAQLVLVNLQRIEQVAQVLNGVELQPADELSAPKPERPG